jgi:hypothetical protein
MPISPILRITSSMVIFVSRCSVFLMPGVPYSA